MRMKLNVFRKGLILISVPLLLHLGFFGVLADMQSSNRQAVAWSLHSKEVLEQTQVVLRTLLETGTGLRGYILSADAELGAAYRRGAEQLPQDIVNLKRSVADNPGQVAQVHAIASATEKFLSWHAETVRQSAAGQREQAVARARSPEADTLMRAIQDAVMTFIATEKSLDDERSHTLTRSQNRQHWLLVAGSTLSVLTTIGLVYLFARNISGRLAALQGNMRRLAHGQELAPAAPGSDEIAVLDRGLRDMALELSRSQGSLREQNQLMQSVLNSIADGVVAADEHGKFVLFNPAAQRIVGFGATEASPSEWPQVYGTYLPDGRTPFPPQEQPLVRAIRGEESDQVEMFIRNANVPEGAWITLTGRPLRDEQGKGRGGVVVFHDITQNKRSQQALRETSERLRLLVENASDYSFLMLDPQGYIQSWNIGGERIKGYRVEEIVGKHFSCFYSAQDVQRGWPAEVLHNAADHGRFEDEGWRVRKDGSRFWANVIVTALRDDSGELRGFSKLTRDLTERKRAADEVARLNRELEQRVRERTAELAEANKDLSAKNRENEMFVYSVSHDLRSPLVNLQGFSKELELSCRDLRDQLIAEEVPVKVRNRAVDLLDRDVAESVHFIQNGVMRLSNIIDALLRLSRAGRVEYQWQEVDVGRVVNRVVESLRGTIAERGATVKVHELPTAWGDAGAIEQVFANLIGNALNYVGSAQGGVVEIGCLTAGVAEEAQQTYFVRDNGIGIPEGYRHKIFQAFQRIHPHMAPGEGMGLAIVRRVVERHGGRVWFEPTGVKGTTFLVSFPMNHQTPPLREPNAGLCVPS
ncbi:MAG TPA: PAS domain S-box protein [Gemmataceae bacterium]|jgi:PAS domain S-box-containing protein|nr:PAS domain S-box protein [Gemmataceae bacterium]